MLQLVHTQHCFIVDSEFKLNTRTKLDIEQTCCVFKLERTCAKVADLIRSVCGLASKSSSAVWLWC